MKLTLAALLMLIFLCLPGCSIFRIPAESPTPAAVTAPDPKPYITNVIIPALIPTQSANAVPQETGFPQELIKESGVYSGQIDNNFIEIYVNDIPQAYMLSAELRESFGALKLDTQDRIEFEYYTNDYSQNVIVSIKKA